MSTSPPDPPASLKGGMPLAVGAYLIWGLIPLYFRMVDEVPAFEIVGWRVVFTLPVCLAIVALRWQGSEVIAALTNLRAMRALVASAALIGCNWTLYVYAVQTGHVLAASLGYYINPLVNVLAGTVLLGERLTRLQWLAVALAAAGVALLAFEAAATLWISLSLALSFCGYGLVRKTAPVESLPGVTVETLLLIPAAAAMIGWYAMHGGSSWGRNTELDIAIAAAGIVTGVPLLLFAAAARRLPYSVLGFVQFLAPTIVFGLGLAVFREPLLPAQLVCFGFIWSAIAVFCWDLLIRARLQRAREA